MTIRDDVKKIVAVADYYYRQRLSKSEISKILGISRQSVTNLLDKAIEDGLVQIKILDPYVWNRALSIKLIEMTGLRDVVTVPVSQNQSDHIKRNIGLAGATYVAGLLKPSQVIGVGWGKTLLETVSNIESKQSTGITVVPIMGGLGRVEYELQVNRISNLLASRIQGCSRQLYAPGIVGSKSAIDSILSAEDISEIIRYWDKLDLALIGVGGLKNISNEDLAPNGYMSIEEAENLNELGAVGDVCMRFYNRDGKDVKVTENWFPIGITLDQLRRVPTVVCIAGGLEKVDAIQGAINGGFIDILISDEVVVQELINRMGAEAG